ncbi:hypothetical protein EPO66_05705 [bacterium]|nr:MAG: hypothetical protein EPO66_05705 [bacterium]
MPGVKGDQLSLYVKDMYKAERESYKEIPTMHDKIFKVVNNVSGAGDKITQLLGVGRLERHTVEGQDIKFKSPVQGWEYLVRYWTYSDGIALTKEAVEDTVKLGNLIKELAGTWGKSVRLAEEDMAATVFNHGGDLLGEWVFNGTHTGNTATYGDMLYDNKPLFNLSGNTRSSKGGGTYYNSVAGLTVTPANFETIYNLHTATNNRDERDEIVSNPADTLLTRCGADAFLAERLLGTERGIPGQQLNDKNPYYKIVTPMSWDYLTESAFYLMKRLTDAMQFHKRQLPEIRFFRDENNRGYKASIDIRQGILIKNWRVITRGGGTSA